MKRCDFKIFIFYWLKFYFKTTQQRQQVSSQYICSVFGKLFFNGKQHAVKLLIHFSWLQVAYDDFSISKFVRLLYISICVYTMFSKKRSIYFEDFIRESDDIQPYRKGGGLGHKNETFSRVFMQRVAYRVYCIRCSNWPERWRRLRRRGAGSPATSRSSTRRTSSATSNP